MSEKYLWVPHKELEWCLALLVSEEPAEDAPADSVCLVEASGGDRRRFKVPKSLTCGLDPTHKMDLANLCQMNNLHEAPLLDILRNRFMRNSIYTYTADVLISVNPYYVIPELYSSPLAYLNVPYLPMADTGHGSEIPPHVYFIANAGLKCLVKPSSGEPVNQSIIVSGESGAGMGYGMHFSYFLVMF
jgi:myosin V